MEFSFLAAFFIVSFLPDYQYLNEDQSEFRRSQSSASVLHTGWPCRYKVYFFFASLVNISLVVSTILCTIDTNLKTKDVFLVIWETSMMTNNCVTLILIFWVFHLLSAQTNIVYVAHSFDFLGIFIFSVCSMECFV